MAFKRPAFLPSLDELEDQAQRRSVHGSTPKGQFDHPTAKYIFFAGIVLVVVGHAAGLLLFFL
ncbi:hypothetical protein [Actinomadura rupiterrae]|uniref:hypothetical protein n=1 Tax=Actinomadura rupiterrae TaxID=559627 RepID=UPI0020A4DD5D|nr:hypothetical protein [Actinomadura rupiterrae]MCP2343101.1 hypothetical protein [Actinomadura rupiterrae]